ncbi:phospholipid-translocating ATPase rsb1 [Teratosphaeriaceae sp. CCFEE 6253]|nr:phospholipid-translocating ATPase rsb1 [Teratosphaeriaceae sp. CCFEE 6253]
MVMGLALEVVGYANRVLLHKNPFNGNAFLIYLITLTIAPVFVSAAIYLSLTRILVLYGQNLSRVTPRIVAISFMSSDFMSLLLQAAGGGIADSADTDSLKNIGVDIMIAGLVLQAISLGVFLLFGADFAWRCRQGVLDQDPERRRTRNSMIFKAFLAGMILATLVILIRSIFRAAELWGGFEGTLWNDEVDFLILDGAMMSVACLCLSALHSGAAFGGQWRAAEWSFRVKKPVATEKDTSSSASTKWLKGIKMGGLRMKK